MKNIYNPEDIEKMKIAFKSKNKSRLQELLNFIKNSNFTKIGIANCMAMQKYADRLNEILKDEGLDVYAVNCKVSGLQNCEIMTGEEGPSCDPIFQAAFLNEKGTELNINVGLCLGHGILFSKHSHAPVTTFIVKDFAVNHNPTTELNLE